MSVCSPPDGYARMVKYGQHKTHIRLDRLILQSFMAGFWVALYGHCCTVFCSILDKDIDFSHKALLKFAYGGLFPGAFIAVAYTGTELFTGNTSAMMMVFLNEPRKTRLKTFFSCLKVLIVSLIGNICGAILGAFLFTYCTNESQGDSDHKFLHSLAEAKVSHQWSTNLVLGIGCNMLVCLATWSTIITDDGAGKILAMWFTVGIFVMGGCEHIVANFYTLSASLMLPHSKITLLQAVWKNWVPVLLGNIIAGFFVIGFTWWYSFSPLPSFSLPLHKDTSCNEIKHPTKHNPIVQQNLLSWANSDRSSSHQMITPSFCQNDTSAPPSSFIATPPI